MVYHTASLAPAGAVLALAVLDKRFAEPGTRVSVAWGEHPGPGTAPEASLEFPRIGATVAARAVQQARPHRVPGGPLTGAALPADPMPALACWPPSQASAGMAVAGLAVASPGSVTSAWPYR